MRGEIGSEDNQVELEFVGFVEKTVFRADFGQGEERLPIVGVAGDNLEEIHFDVLGKTLGWKCCGYG